MGLSVSLKLRHGIIRILGMGFSVCFKTQNCKDTGDRVFSVLTHWSLRILGIRFSMSQVTSAQNNKDAGTMVFSVLNKHSLQRWTKALFAKYAHTNIYTQVQNTRTQKARIWKQHQHFHIYVSEHSICRFRIYCHMTREIDCTSNLGA